MNWDNFWKDYERIKKSVDKVNKKNKQRYPVTIIISSRLRKTK